MSFTGGKLKLKGVDVAKGGIKKKRKRKAVVDADGTELAVASDTPQQGEEDGRQPPAGEAGQSTFEGSVPAPPEDRRTEAEKRHEAHLAKLEAERAKTAALKSHRERIADMNAKLATLSEHNDIPRISYSYM